MKRTLIVILFLISKLSFSQTNKIHYFQSDKGDNWYYNDLKAVINDKVFTLITEDDREIEEPEIKKVYDFNGNGYDDVLVWDQVRSSYILGQITIFSFDGIKFRESAHIGWSEYYNEPYLENGEMIFIIDEPNDPHTFNGADNCKFKFEGYDFKRITPIDKRLKAIKELWSYDFLAKLASLLNDNGVIVTYSAAFPIRGALLKCGLTIGETPSFGRKKGGTIASFAIDKISSPLTSKEINILTKSTAGVPYRDKNLNRSRDIICEYSNKLVKKLQSMGIPKWWKKG